MWYPICDIISLSSEERRPILNHRQVIKGDYVITPIANAFNSKVSYWISKRGYMYSLYCFTPTDFKDLEYQLNNFDAYVKMFDASFF